MVTNLGFRHGHYCLIFLSGFHGDLNETYPVGKISEENASLIRTSRKCLDEAIKICKPGALFRDIGKVMSVKYNECTLPDSLFLSTVAQRTHRSCEWLLLRKDIHWSRNQSIIPYCTECTALCQK